METSEKVQKYIDASQEWLEAAEETVETSPNPAAFNALHAMELAAKACLMEKTGEEFTTHQVGGSFGKHFREETGEETVRELNKYMMRYSHLRYPNAKSVSVEEAEEILDFAKEFIKEIVPSLFPDL